MSAKRSEKKSEKKSEKLEVRMTRAEKEALRAEADSKGMTVSDLVRKILTDHIIEQPHWKLISEPLKNHPRKVTSGLIALLSGIGVGMATIPFAAAQNLVVDVSGKIDGQFNDERTRQAFNSTLVLKMGERGTLTLPQNPNVPGSKPVEIEIVVTTANPEEYDANKPVYQLAIRVIEDQETVVSPNIVTEENEEANIVYGIDPTRTYTISATVRPE